MRTCLLRWKSAALLVAPTLLLGALSIVGPDLASAAIAAPVTRSASATEREAVTLFRPDTRLEQKISAAWRGEALSAALGSLSRELGVKLTGSRDTADEKVVLFVKDCPANEVLAKLGGHLDFQWVRKGEGYELGQDLARKQRETALRDQEWSRIQDYLRELARVRNLPLGQRRQREVAVQARLDDPALPAEERVRLEREWEMLLANEPAIVAAALFHTLPPAHIAQLTRTGVLRFSTANGSLPPALVGLVHQEYEPARKERGTPLQADVLFRLTDASTATGPPATGGRRTRLEVTLRSIRGTRESPEEAAAPTWSLQLPVAGAVGSPITLQPADDPDLKLPVSFRVPAPEVGPEAAQGGAIARAATRWPGGLMTLGELAAELHRQTGLNFVGDGFIRARLDRKLLAEPRPLRELLDLVARELDYEWSKQGPWVWLRSRTYFSDRPGEVPERILGPWRKTAGTQPVPTLDALAQLAGALNEDQCRGMQDYWGWYLENTGILAPTRGGGVYDLRHHLRLWNSLAPAQKQTLRGGGVLAVRSMTGPQRQAFLIALAAAPESEWTTRELLWIPPDPTVADVQSGGFSLKAEDYQEQLYTDAEGRTHTVRSDVASTRLLEQIGEMVEGPRSVATGPALRLDAHHFAYHLRGRQEPVRQVTLFAPHSIRRR